MKSIRKQDVSNELYTLARSGASIHQILSKLRNVSFDEAQAAIQQVAEDNKQAGPAHRANLRNLIREQATGALTIIQQLARDESQPSMIRLKAAETLLKYAAEYVDETVMRSWQERPDVNVELQPTIFDFGPIIEENGEIAFRGETKLTLISNGED